MSALAEYIPTGPEPLPDYGPPLPALLRRYIKASGLTYTALARRCGTTESTIWRIAHGERRCYRYVLLRIAAELELTPPEIDRLLITAGIAPTWAASGPVRNLVAILRNCDEHTRRSITAQLESMRIRHSTD